MRHLEGKDEEKPAHTVHLQYRVSVELLWAV